MVVIYITTAVVGAALRPGYSHIRDSVSELIEVGAPNKALLDTMISFYHVMLIMFAYGLHLALPHTRRGWLGPALLGVTGILGIILTASFHVMWVARPTPRRSGARATAYSWPSVLCWSSRGWWL